MNSINKMEKLIKIVLAILFFICLLDMPYGYFQFVRLAGFVGFIYLAYQANENKNQQGMILFVCLAILFQPFMKISLGRTLWNIVDIIVGVGLVASAFMNIKRR
jgi:hypothetical protein